MAVLAGAAVIGIAGTWLLARVGARMGLKVGLLGLALFLPVAAYGELDPVLDSERAVYPSGWTIPEPIAASARIRSIGDDVGDYDVIGLYVVQWFLPHTSVELFDGGHQPPPSRYVLSGAAWPPEHPASRPKALWRVAGRDEVLWQLARGEPGRR